MPITKSDIPIPTFIDIEASGFGGFPIEIAFNLGDDVQSTLIYPADTWSEQEWDDEAEAVHGIAWQELFAEGKPVMQVAQWLNDNLVGRTVYCDGGEHDQGWLNRLYAASGIECRFTLGSVLALFRDTFDFHYLAYLDSPEAPITVHRAAGDVAQLMALWRRLAGSELR